MKSLDDEHLMRLLMDDNVLPALEELYARYSKKLLGYFYKMFNKDLEKSHDFVQDLFLKVMEKKHLFNPQFRFYTWIFTIATNMCKSEYRRPYHNVFSEQDANRAQNRSVYSENLADKTWFTDQLEQAISGLEEQHKTTFVLRYLEEFSLQEIADITEVSLGTVKSRLFYSSRKIAELLKEFNPKNESHVFNLK